MVEDFIDGLIRNRVDDAKESVSDAFYSMLRESASGILEILAVGMVALMVYSAFCIMLKQKDKIDWFFGGLMGYAIATLARKFFFGV